jgi:drug/metabolite transporter (DMT)-like permease
MRIALAFIFIVLLWSTTPLAIKWSAEGSSFIFGVAARMVIGKIPRVGHLKFPRLTENSFVLPC